MSNLWKWILGVIVALLLISLAFTLFHYVVHYVITYGLIFLSVIGAIVLLRWFFFGHRTVRLDSGRINPRKIEAKAHRELKKMEEKIRR